MPPITDWQFLVRVPPGHIAADAGGSVWTIDIPTWITALATLALAVFAIFTTYYARKAFLGQSKEISDQAEMLKVQSDQLAEQRKINEKQTEVLELQAAELRDSLAERKREADERRRAQASQIFIFEERLDADPRVPQSARAASGQQPQPVVVAHIMNASEQPVYHVSISWHLGHKPEGHHRRMPLMPGSEDEDIMAVPAGADPTVFGAVAFFRDAAGVTWRTRPDGQLDEIPEGQEPPHSW